MPLSGPYRRRSARVLLVDGSDRVLLLRLRDHGGHIWLTPGGGVQDGEPLAEAAARELREEGGLAGAAAGGRRGGGGRAVPAAGLGEPVAHTGGYVRFSWAEGIFRDEFFLHRVAAHEIDTSGMEELEAGQHAG